MINKPVRFVEGIIIDANGKMIADLIEVDKPRNGKYLAQIINDYEEWRAVETVDDLPKVGGYYWWSPNPARLAAGENPVVRKFAPDLLRFARDYSAWMPYREPAPYSPKNEKGEGDGE